MIKKIALLSITLLQLHAADGTHEQLKEFLERDDLHLFSWERLQEDSKPLKKKAEQKLETHPHRPLIFQQLSFPGVLDLIDQQKLAAYIELLSGYIAENPPKKFTTRLKHRRAQMRKILSTCEASEPDLQVPAKLFDKKISDVKRIIKASDPHMRALWVSLLLTKADIPKLHRVFQQFKSVGFKLPFEFLTATGQLMCEEFTYMVGELRALEKQNKTLQEKQEPIQKEVNEIEEQLKSLEIKKAERNTEYSGLQKQKNELKQKHGLVKKKALTLINAAEIFESKPICHESFWDLFADG